MNLDLRVFREIKAAPDLRENRAFRGSKAKKGIPVKRPQLQLSKIRLSAIN